MNINMDSTPSEIETKRPLSSESEICLFLVMKCLFPKLRLWQSMLGLRLKTLPLSLLRHTAELRISCIYLPAKEMTFASRHTYQASYDSIASCFAFRFCEKEDKSFECWQIETTQAAQALKSQTGLWDFASFPMFLLGFRTIDSSPSHHFRSRLLASEIPLGPLGDFGKVIETMVLTGKEHCTKVHDQNCRPKKLLEMKWQEAAQNQTCAVHYACNIYACIIWICSSPKATSCHLHSFAALRSVEPYAVHYAVILSFIMEKVWVL